MFKFLHTSDWHSGAGRNLTKGSLEYLERSKWHWRECIRIAREKEVDFAIIAGDLFENWNTTVPEFLALVDVIREFTEVCPVVASDGNHDELTTGRFQSEYLELLKIPRFHITPGQPGHYGILTKSGETPTILMYPWTGIKNQQEFNQYLTEHYQGEQIVGLHECFRQSRTDSGRIAKTGVSVPDMTGVKYFACGDIHMHQNLGLPHAFFSGAPAQYNFGDLPNKGCIVVTGHASKPYEVEFVPIKSAIELHTIGSLGEIPKDSPHWYKLRCSAAQLPAEMPACVKDYELIPTEIDGLTEIPEGGDSPVTIQRVDYSEGVEQLLADAQFDYTLIDRVKQEIQKVTEAAT
jgi:exonuclease SbcD